MGRVEPMTKLEETDQTDHTVNSEHITVQAAIIKMPHISVRNFFLTVLEAERSRHQQIECLVGTHFLVHRQLSSHCVLVWQKGWGRSLGSLFQGHSSHSLGLHPYDFISKCPTSKCHHFEGLGSPLMDWGGIKTFSR